MTWVYTGSTIVWLLTIILAVVFTIIDFDTVFINLLVAIITTIIWATVILNVGRPYWPPVAFALLVIAFILELLFDIAILAG